ncbi:TPA: hypothetical protein N0F65_009105 [Lagenidium giganteum]|uniref:Transposase n=1 Tax=Lagenidium giganteum TaxID=4803 RepID=A0AAV2YP37_9STRA|nr:TPA: hypothetical protein N0F65_009103 [Lagenidium giganteum]DAZ95943.1 TPA: hypothetical protein N0F65_009105 [Lagenidium giganteum]
MRRATFNELRAHVRPHITLTDTHIRRSVSPDTALSVFVSYVAHGVSYRELSEKFPVGYSTSSYMIRRVSDALSANVDFLRTVDELRQIIAVNEAKTGVRQCTLCVDGTHVPIGKSAQSGRE